MYTPNQILAFSFVVSLGIFSSVTKASEHVLATITTDVNSDSYQFIVDADEDARLLKNFFIDNFVDGKKVKRDAVSMDQFISTGLKLPKNSKVKFAEINGQNFDQTLGGNFEINTLYNALTGKRKSYDFEMLQTSGQWSLYYSGKLITKIQAIAHHVPIVGIVGAKDLLMK